MEFDARDQLQALAALPPEPPKPAAPKTSAWSAPFRALPAGVAEVGAMLAESVKGFGQALDATGTAGAGGMFGGQTDAERAQSERMREQIRTRGLQGGSEVSRSLRNVADGYGPDPLTASKAEQIVFGLTKGVSKAVGYGLTTGPAAPLLFGLDEGLTETDRLQRQGVDNVTAGRVGMVAGGVNAAGMALPVAGATVRQTAALATLGGPASFVAQQMASREILSRADYHDIAATFDPLDPWGLALSSLPYGFGAWAMRSRMRGAPVRAPVRDQAPADGAAGVADTRPTPEPVRPVEAPPMERTPVAHAVQEAMPREAVDAAMVQHITDASQFMRVWESPPVESLASFAARTLPEVAPVRAASGPDPFLSWLRAQGGVNFADKFDITGEANAIRSNRGGVFRKAGRGIDELAQAAEAEGWLPPGTVADVDGGTPQMRDMIQRAMQGERIAPLADQFAGLEARGRAHADEMRAAEMEQRLRLLGEDPTPARGNVEVLQAYLDQHEPRLLAAALAEEAAARRAAAIDDFPTPAAQPITARAEMVQSLRAQLEATGRPADEAAAGAALMSRWYEVQAARVGMTPKDLAERYPLRIQATAAGGAVNAMEQGVRVVDPNALTFREADQNRTDGVAEAFPNTSDMPPIVTIIEEDGENTILDGHNRAAVARDRGDGVQAVSLTRAQYEELSDAGYDDIEIAYAALRENGEQDAADALDSQFPGAGVGRRGTSAWANFPEGATLNQSARLPDTIDIDGQQRTTTNSKGQQIAQTEEGVRNFWRWFGDSKVVDEQGRPLVVYHGTASDFNVFDDKVRGGRQRHYFAADPGVASEYRGGSKGANVLPVFVSLQDPLQIDADGFSFAGIENGVLPDRLLALLPENVIKRGYMGFSEVAQFAESAGYDGVIADNLTDGAGKYGDTTPTKIVVAFRPEQIKSAIGNRGTFDPNDASILNQNARGQIAFGPDITQTPSVISLFKSADASTFLHESGHFFLEAQLDMAARMGDEAGAIKADAQTLLDWFGVKSPGEWAAMSIDQKRPHHEQFAQAFERYLADGKAPAPGLQGLFDQFAQWLKAVYRDITGLGADITPEVRSVMDRMLATDEEIAAARPPADASPRDIADRASAGFRKGKSLEAWLSSATYPGGLRSVIDALGLDVPKGTYIGEAIKRVQAAIGPAPDTGARPVSYVDTRGTGIRLHGTSKAIAALSDQYAMAGDNRNIYGQGFYTTDAADIAAGYMKKGRNGDPALYEVKQKDVPLFDMEAPITEPIKAMLRSTMGDNMPTENAETGAKLTNLREVFDEFRRESQNNGMSRDHVQEVFDSIRTSLEQMGFRGYEHVGGGNTGKQAHNVRIFWFPEQDISITPTTLDRFKTPETADASPPPANRPQEASPASSPKEPALPPIEPGSGPDHAAIQSVRSRADQVVIEAPDLVVGHNEDGSSITAREALERIRQEAQAGTEDTLGGSDAHLLDVAVQCALSVGG